MADLARVYVISKLLLHFTRLQVACKRLCAASACARSAHNACAGLLSPAALLRARAPSGPRIHFARAGTWRRRASLVRSHACAGIAAVVCLVLHCAPTDLNSCPALLRARRPCRPRSRRTVPAIRVLVLRTAGRALILPRVPLVKLTMDRAFPEFALLLSKQRLGRRVRAVNANGLHGDRSGAVSLSDTAWLTASLPIEAPNRPTTDLTGARSRRRGW